MYNRTTLIEALEYQYTMLQEDVKNTSDDITRKEWDNITHRLVCIFTLLRELNTDITYDPTADILDIAFHIIKVAKDVLEDNLN